jgi:hypothetical protein
MTDHHYQAMKDNWQRATKEAASMAIARTDEQLATHTLYQAAIAKSDYWALRMQQYALHREVYGLSAKLSLFLMLSNAGKNVMRDYRAFMPHYDLCPHCGRSAQLGDHSPVINSEPDRAEYNCQYDNEIPF